MLSWQAAQGLVDGLSACTLGASALAVSRQPSALRSRLGFTFSCLCLFFAARAFDAAFDWPAMALATLLIACALPFAALLLAEGVLRRHAPPALKVLTAAGAALVAAALLVLGGARAVSDWLLGLYVVSSLSGVTLLLTTRDRAGLSRQENARVAALVGAGALVTIAAVTDFLPAAPIGLSGVGAAAIAFVFAANPNSAHDARRTMLELALLAALAAAAAWLLSLPLDLVEPSERVRLAAVLMALLLATDALVSAIKRRSGAHRQRLVQALARADLKNLDSFLEDIAGQPLLAGMLVAEGPQLSSYDARNLSSALSAKPVWTSTAIMSEPSAARPFEELADLMVRTEATHAVLLSPAPLRIALLTLPEGGGAQDLEAELALFGRLASIAAEGSS